MKTIIATVLVALSIAMFRADDTLAVYFIDVEGGQSTLIVTPARESLLVDTGYPGMRDASRIMAAVRDAGLTEIDYLLITHFHPDHDGGVVELSRQVPIRTFIDHGDLGTEGIKVARPESIAAFHAYAAIRSKGKHLQPRPGERLPLKGVDVTFVSSAGQTIRTPIDGGGAPTSNCPASAAPAPNFENPMSTGFHLRFGEFRFIDLGDLSGEPLHALLCPANKLGRIDAYLVPHHGGADVAHPAYAAALAPRVAILNSGATKGGDAVTFEMLRAARLQDVWQIDRSRRDGVVNFSDDRIANLDDGTAHWLKLSAQPDGVFRITNQRTSQTIVYARRPD